MEDQLYNSQNFVPNKQKVQRPPIGTYIMLIIYSLYILFPMYIIFVTAIKSQPFEIIETKFIWWPTDPAFDNFAKVFTENGDLIRGLMNTLQFSLPPLIVGLLSSALASYGFAKLEWKGRESIFGFLMLTMMIPGTVTMSAAVLMYDTIGWLGTPYPLMIPGMFGGIGTVFFLRQYMKGIPDDLIGAAKIDGMSEIRIFLTLIIPLSVPALLTQGVLGFIGAYNDYLGALVYVGAYEPLWTLQIVLSTLQGKRPHALYKPLNMATVFMGMMPMLIIYIFLQNYILKGISMSSGLKG